MRSLDEQKLRTRRFNVSVARNGGKNPLRLADVRPEDVPVRFHRIDIDRSAVRSALEDGEVLGFASPDERGQHLRVR